MQREWEHRPKHYQIIKKKRVIESILNGEGIRKLILIDLLGTTEE
jgi:hypothetical protein